MFNVVSHCEMHIKTTEILLQPVEWQKLKRRGQGGGRNGVVMHCSWEWKMAQSLWKNFG